MFRQTLQEGHLFRKKFVTVPNTSKGKRLHHYGPSQKIKRYEHTVCPLTSNIGETREYKFQNANDSSQGF
jgi:hypothetical protein